jgi:hypothetical protein
MMVKAINNNSASTLVHGQSLLKFSTVQQLTFYNFVAVLITRAYNNKCSAKNNIEACRPVAR